MAASRLSLNYQRYFQGTPEIDPNGDPTIPDLAGFSLDAWAGANEGRRNLFEGGDFVPGGGLAAAAFRVFERGESGTDPGYHLLFGRFSSDFVSRKLVSDPASSGGSFGTTDVVETDLRATLGYNFAPNENLVLGLSGTLGYEVDSVEDLEEADFCTVEATGTADGVPIRLEDCDKRFVGDAIDQISGQIRTDVTYNLLSLGEKGKSATLGLVAAASVDFNETSDPAVNLAFGPTLHPPGLPQEIVFAVLLQGLDVGSSRPRDDRFRVTAYVGVPFNLFATRTD